MSKLMLFCADKLSRSVNTGLLAIRVAPDWVGLEWGGDEDEAGAAEGEDIAAPG